MKKIRIFFEYLAAFITIFLLLLVITSVVVVKFYGDEVQETAMELINGQLNTSVSVEEVGITVFRRFPNTAVYLKNVTIWSGDQFNRNEFWQNSPDTLLHTEKIYLEFSLFDLLKKRYFVRSMEIRNGSLKMYVDSEGGGNFLIASGREKEESSRLIEIKNLLLKEIDVLFINKAKAIDAEVTLQEIYFEGNFLKKDYLLKTGGKALVRTISNHGVTYLTNEELKTELSVNVKNNQFAISRGDILLGNLSVGLTGEFQLTPENGTILDLKFYGKRIDIGWLTRILASRDNNAYNIAGSGDVDLSMNVKGLATKTISPHIEGSFSTKKSSLALNSYSLSLKSLSLEGTFTNGVNNSPTSTTVKIQSFRTLIGSSTIFGNLRLENFIDPQIDLSLQGDIYGTDISKYFTDLPVSFHEGIISPKLFINGTLSKGEGGKRKVTITPNGSIALKHLFLSISQPGIALDSVNGVMKISSTVLDADLSGYLGNTDFIVDLSANNPMNSLSVKKVFEIEGSVKSRNVNIDELIANLKNDNRVSKTSKYPETIKLDLDFNFEKITKGGIETELVTGKLLYIYPSLYIDPIHLKTMNGTIHSRIGLTDLHKQSHQASIYSTFQNVDIQSLFRSFNNFGQTFLSDKNIAGTVSGESALSTQLNSEFKISSDDIISENTIRIENGELINFEPMMELATFLKIDEMDHIRFSTLNNTILIRENVITIPAMEIKSTAMNIQTSGVHGFNKTYDYHLATKLSEYLFNKARSSGKQEFDIALDSEDRRTIFLHLYDHGKGLKIEFDEDQAIKKIRGDLKEEKTELKTILNEEFGLFKSEEEFHEVPEKSAEPGFKFEFQEEVQPDTIKAPDNKTKWWQKKKEPDKKPAFEFVIDDNNI